MVQAPPVIILCGATAVGKTGVATELAQKINAEIISADSGQIYRGMDIGTAKPTSDEQKKVRFHLIDILNPNEIFSAAEFRKRAIEAIADIQRRGRRVIVAGGTGLYLRALEQGLFEGPSNDPAIRADLEKKITEEGVESLHRELEKVDPEAAKAIPSRNRQRLIRALEVFRVTGRPISAFWKEQRSRGEPCVRPVFVKFGLNLPKEELHRRIEERIDHMIAHGLIDEVRSLVGTWGPTAPGLKLIGCKEIVAHLAGQFPLLDSISLIKRHTRQYAKRQGTWFKKDKDIQWFSGAKEIIQHLTK